VIRRVEIARRARKQLGTVPNHIRRKLLIWVLAVEADGLEVVRRVSGYHDEALQGDRFGQRSIRLNAAWRAIYEIRRDVVEFVSVEEVSKHDY
jgi:proteic killer suppression protein